ncbi:uncharacterized protein LOC111088555 isoform X2 [Limulus polyphemus]|uniref:Uncharacterized protein LOC111088555 isoform X2 n=1 Tax=Limulus polyphemus TaxID=6850 RepID=A0ABM1TFT8_LIMPO|nr:uncharacterized protein LOC111088555 isoform X2 [Limulus polyphemus]
MKEKTSKDNNDVLASGDYIQNEVTSNDDKMNHTQWSQWSSCSHTCGGGKRTRIRWCKGNVTFCYGDVMQFQFCNTAVCLVAGNWSNWTNWTTCSVTCGSGRQVRFRKCDNPFPRAGGACPGSSTQFKRCNTEIICPVNGSWTVWSEWSECTYTCGLGTHYRDRSCSDPAPQGTGNLCEGQATEVSHCFETPCFEKQQVAVFEGISFLFYPRAAIPTTVLEIYARVKPKSTSGTIVSRYTPSCNYINCTNTVELVLLRGTAVLKATVEKASLEVKGGTNLQTDMWNTIFAWIVGQKGFIRVNDEPNHQEKEFNHKLPEDINYDHVMYVGINHKNSLGPEAVHSGFKDDYYVLVPCKTGAGGLIITLNIWPVGLNGLVIFHQGVDLGSYMFLTFEEQKLKFCVRTDGDQICVLGSEALEVKKWYRIEVSAVETVLSIRVNHDGHEWKSFPNVQFQCLGHLYLGGADKNTKQKFEILSKVNGKFEGSVSSVEINGQIHWVHELPLMETKNMIGSETASIAAHYNEYHVHKSTQLELKCNYSSLLGSWNKKSVSIQWLNVDTRIDINDPYRHVAQSETQLGTSLIKLTSYEEAISGKKAEPKHLGSLYACLASYEDNAFIIHAFGVSYHNIKFGTDCSTYWWLYALLILLLLAVIIKICLTFWSSRYEVY